ncbi:MAG TPA: glycosyltransferase [Thermoanaerobaculia bacterium]|jgi:glycosyltransferase involved in cell wall biosynthesis|nr:glycosyltransferase [Thermoanaerobaculia bacterium]
MKILFVSWHCLDGTAEGLASSRVASALARRGHEVTLLTRKLLEPEPFNHLDLDRWGRPLGRITALPHLLRGCTVEEKGWARAVARKAAELGPFDVLHSRLNPAASHLAALEVLKRIELPWCAYFSDPWPHHLYPEPYRFTVGPLSRRRLELSLDGMLRRADSLVFPSGRLRDWLLSGRREQYRGKAFIAPHLGEEGAAPAPASNGHLHIRHAGFLMKERRIEPLLAALERLRPEVRNDLRVEFAGRYAIQPKDSDAVSFEPSMPPDAVRAWMAGADVALLVEAALAEGLFFPSKLSDYLAGGRPILALSPCRGVTADLLASGGGLLVEPEDEAGIAAALERLHGLWREGRLAELAPGPEQAAAVSEGTVVPVYERAFEEARR